MTLVTLAKNSTPKVVTFYVWYIKTVYLLKRLLYYIIQFSVSTSKIELVVNLDVSSDFLMLSQVKVAADVYLTIKSLKMLVALYGGKKCPAAGVPHKE